MKRKNKNKLAVITLLVILFQPVYIKADVSDAVTYLQAQTQDSWITQALVAAGVGGVEKSHLSEVSGTLATDYAKTILALAAAGENPATFGSIDFVVKLKTYFSDSQMGDVSLLNDDMWSILALSSVGEVDSVEAVAAKNFLLSNQNTDGGWGYSVGGDSDTNDTATAIMALVESGVSTSDLVITNAIVYLQSAQNDDGGFGWMIGSGSDSGSDSWVISALHKINIDPLSWDKGGNTPISHLESLQDTDGGFWWVEEGTSEFNNKAMTAYAVIALSGESFPVGYYGDASLGNFRLRIEGQNGNICDTYVAATTALDIVESADEACGYTYVITTSSFGDYLSQVNDEAAAGLSGWMYFVNDESLLVGAGDYPLAEGDEVLWYYGDWGWHPTRLSVDDNSLDTGDLVTIKVEYFDGSSWFDLDSATVKGGDQHYVTDTFGEALVSMPDSVYNIYAEKEGYVRSNTEYISVGQQGVSQNVSLVVEIDQGGGVGGDDGVVLGSAIIFEVTPDSLNFGKLSPGNTDSQILNLENSGTVDLDISATVTGNSLFTNNLNLDSEIWSNYGTDLEVDEDKDVDVELSVPAEYLESGVKSGELIFWAQAE